MEYHRLAEKYPRRAGESLQMLKDDIAKYGQQKPIWLFNGMIANGRHRYEICNELGIEPQYIDYEGTEAQLARDLYLDHAMGKPMTPEQRAIALFDFEQAYIDDAQDNRSKNATINNQRRVDPKSANLHSLESKDKLQRMADDAGTSRRNIAKLQKVVKKSKPLTDAVSVGEMSIHQAHEATKDEEFIESINTPNTEVKDFEKRSREIAQEWKRRQQEKAKQEKENPQPKSQATLNHKDTAERIKAFRQFLADEMPSTIKAGWLDDIQQRSWHITKLEEIQNQIDTILDMLGD